MNSLPLHPCRRFPRSTQKPALSSRRLCTDHRTDSKQVTTELMLSSRLPLSFDGFNSLSIDLQRFNGFRLLNTHLTESCPALSLTLNTIAFDCSTLGRFALSTCIAIARGLLSS